MGERKGTNKYYPPDFDPKKHKSLAGYTGAHPLRERARKLHLGILIIRFEMPYNIWCGGCNSHIGMGVRYNAEKTKIGNYYSTPLWKFRMKCHLCDNHFEIKTDPANHDYVIISGARRKEQRWDPKENEQIVPEDKSTQKKLALDAMYKLEHGELDKGKTKETLPTIGKIQQSQMSKKEDYLLNKLARNKFREQKKSIKSNAETDQALLEKSSLDIKLVGENDEDVRLAELLKFKSLESFDQKQKLKRDEIGQRPLFDSNVKPLSVKASPRNIAKTHLEKIAAQKKITGFSFVSKKNKRAVQNAAFGVIIKKKDAQSTCSEIASNLPSPSTSATSSNLEDSDDDVNEEMDSHFKTSPTGVSDGSESNVKDIDSPHRFDIMPDEHLGNVNNASVSSSLPNDSTSIGANTALNILGSYGSDTSNSDSDK